MSHYQERLERDLAAIREELAAVAAQIERALRDAGSALLRRDLTLAGDTILGDLAINRAIRRIDALCHGFVARHLPSAGHLRFVSSVLRSNVALERVGDYAVTICRETVQLSNPPPPEVARDIELMAEQSRRIMTQAMQAFVGGNAELARGTIGMARQVDATSDKVFGDLVQAGEQSGRAMPLKDLFALLVVFNRLDRVSDQAKNICEETIFAVTGEVKAPKQYRVLFIDALNERASQIAEAYARKAFPESGRYASAGWSPGREIPAEVVEFMDARGHDLRAARPKQLEVGHDRLSEQHVVVSLEPDARAHLPSLPYHTVLLEWDLATSATSAGGGAAGLDELFKQVAHKTRLLMETLRGEGAT